MERERKRDTLRVREKRQREQRQEEKIGQKNTLIRDKKRERDKERKKEKYKNIPGLD